MDVCARALLLVLLSCIVAAVTEPNTEDASVVGGHSHVPQPSSSEEFGYPQNISDVFKGTWRLSGNDSALVGLLHKTSKQSDEREADEEQDTDWMGTFPFRKTDGHSLLKLVVKNASDDGLSAFVRGDMVLRDGIYSTDPNLKMSLAGFYYKDSGMLYMLAVTMSSSIKDISSMIETNGTVSQLESSLSNIVDLAEYARNSSFSNVCYFRMVLQVAKMSQLDLTLMKRREQNPDARRRGDPLISFNGMADSPSCNFQLGIDVRAIVFEEYYTKAVNFVIMVTFLSFIQVLLLIRQMEYTGTPAISARMSLLSIGMQAVLDSYICLLHLTTGIFIESVFNAFATAAFLKFIMFSIFEMRYLLVIWKARRPQQFNIGQNVMRRELSALYARIYLSLIGGFVIMYCLSGYFYIFVFMIYSYWVPQVVCNIMRNTKGSLCKKYLIGMTITRLCIPLYFYSCPVNFIHLEPNYHFAVLLVMWSVFQVFVLLLQDVYGPRFFVPKQLLPAKYDYYHKLVFSPGEERECVICMCMVEPAAVDYMITPCNHLFHSRCLSQWMEFKMECPTCRRALPAQ